jgi:hypothetical protein
MALSTPVLSADFTREKEFSAHYAYLDAEAGKIAQHFYYVNGIKHGNTWVISAAGVDPSASGAHAECKATFKGRTVGPNHLIAEDRGEAFGKFELRKEGEYVRIKSLTDGPCLKQGLYLVPQGLD